VTMLAAEPQILKGEWMPKTAGGGPELLTFRQNPVFVVENRGTREARMVCLLRHIFDVPVGSNYPETAMCVTSSSGSTLPSTLITTCLMTWNNHNILLTSRPEAAPLTSVVVEIPANTSYYLVAFTTGKILGRFEIDVFMQTGQTKLSVAPLTPNVYMRTPIEVMVTMEPRGPGRQAYVHVNDATEVHVLLRSLNGTDEDIQMEGRINILVFDDVGKRLVHLPEPSSYRETGVVFKTSKAMLFTILLQCPDGGDPFPCLLAVYTSKRAAGRFVDKPSGIVSIEQIAAKELREADRRRSLAPRPPAGPFSNGSPRLLSISAGLEEAFPQSAAALKSKREPSISFGSGANRNL